jgi:hypothetical protein
VGDDGNTVIEPFVVGTIARFDVIAPSTAFNVAASGCCSPSVVELHRNAESHAI